MTMVEAACIVEYTRDLGPPGTRGKTPQPRKQLLEMTHNSFGDIAICMQLFDQHCLNRTESSPIQSNPVHSPFHSPVQLLQRLPLGAEKSIWS